MTVSNLKDLEAVIKLMRKTGVEHMIVNGIEINLGPEPIKYKETKAAPKANVQDAIARIMNPGVAYAPTEDSQITTDDLTPEQILLWSVGPENEG